MSKFSLRAKGAFDLLFRPKKMKKVNGFFEMLDGYAPAFYTYDGGVYEMELTRTCIHTFANHCSKLQPSVTGPDLHRIKKILETKPNMFMTSSQFLYKCATIYEAHNTCWIIPILDRNDAIVGFYPVNPLDVEIVSVEETDEPYIRYTFRNGRVGAIELSRCGVVSKYLYKHDLVGENNACLAPTMQLLDLQRQGIAEGIKNGASFRFMANIGNFAKAEDIKKERKRFVEENFGTESGGLALFPNTYTNVQQIKSNPQVVDSEQMKIIEERVYNYFGTNKDIVQNTSVGDKWAAYYEGKIEPFAIQLSQAMTCMTYSEGEMSRNNSISFSSSRLQYMTNKDKLEMSTLMFDRGILTLNDIMDIWNLPHVEDGDKRYIRKEYTEMNKLDAELALPEPTTPTEDTEVQNDTE